MSQAPSVFEDLGFSSWEAKRLEKRSELFYYVRTEIKRLGWTQKQAAARLGVTQPRVSDLMRGRLHLFSIDMLMEMMDRLDYDVAFDVSRRAVSEDAWADAPIGIVPLCVVAWGANFHQEPHGDREDSAA
ncbi:helix-turn-helix domain-containing protein [Luteitalea sp.]